MIINGKNGKMYRKDFQNDGRIIGKYTFLDPTSHWYKSNGDYYVVWDAEKAIWSLIHSYVDKDYETRKKEEESINSMPKFLAGCSSLYDLLRYNREKTLIVENCFDKKNYKFCFVSSGNPFLTRFNTFLFDFETGVIEQNERNSEVYKIGHLSIWKIIGK